MSGVGFEPTNHQGLVLETNCVDRLHTLTAENPKDKLFIP